MEALCGEIVINVTNFHAFGSILGMHQGLSAPVFRRQFVTMSQTGLGQSLVAVDVDFVPLGAEFGALSLFDPWVCCWDFLLVMPYVLVVNLCCSHRVIRASGFWLLDFASDWSSSVFVKLRSLYTEPVAVVRVILSSLWQFSIDITIKLHHVWPIQIGRSSCFEAGKLGRFPVPRTYLASCRQLFVTSIRSGRSIHRLTFCTACGVLGMRAWLLVNSKIKQVNLLRV
ncbi:hypothetical protein OUZ56_020343 [Daphnia magna]|uniref:Uncharacterized protein n=1 Tax=Daphnia magna TaxID=35525 RepID=A0ABQ9ZF91_9CRUS|nr:hypothetical protein OUZ56_020343 [Daphnia magna]